MLRDMLLQCADLSLQKSLRDTIGSTTMANMSVAGLMTELKKETSGGDKPELYKSRGNVTTKKGHNIILWKDVWRREKRSQHSTDTSDTSETLHIKSEGDGDACALMAEIIPVRSSSNNRDDGNSRNEPSGIVAVLMPEIGTITLEHGQRAEERSPSYKNEAQAGDPIKMKGKCWRCDLEGHSGRAQAHIRKVSCAAFNSVCQQCDVIVHYTNVCKRGDKKNKSRSEGVRNPLRDLHIGQTKQSNMDRTPIDVMNIGTNETVFGMDMGDEERFRMPIPKSMVLCNGLTKMHTEAKQPSKKTDTRITVAVAALTYEKNNMGHMRQYQGLLVYNNSGIPRNRTEEPLVGWIVAKTTRARN